MNPWTYLASNPAHVAYACFALAALLVVACTFAACRAGAFADAASEECARLIDELAASIDASAAALARAQAELDEAVDLAAWTGEMRS